MKTTLELLRERLRESFDAFYDGYVDPLDAIDDGDRERWSLAGDNSPGGGPGMPYTNEHELASIRNQCRALAVSNEFAINGHENRVSFVVGTGHAYRVSARPGIEAPRLVGEVQETIDTFLRVNQWHKRQQEIVRRRDRDGEAFLRFFTAADGTVRVRFVEPGQVATPPHRLTDPAAALGIQTDRDDVETVLGYWIDGQWVDAAEIQHRKANVDANVRRGLPLFYPVRKNLRRAERLLRNMSAVAEIQSAIALIRKHAAGSRASLERFVAEGADAAIAEPGRMSYLRRYGPGTIVDTFAGTEYEFPVAGLDAARYVEVLQAELRAIAARLVMPEFMLTSDASNANYASTMVAEGPAVRMFQRLQHELVEEDREVLDRGVQAAIDAGKLPPEAATAVAIQAVPPSLAVRDRLREAQADQILVRHGAMSIATMAMRHGLEPDRERQLRGEIGVANEARAGRGGGLQSRSDDCVEFCD